MVVSSSYQYGGAPHLIYSSVGRGQSAQDRQGRYVFRLTIYPSFSLGVLYFFVVFVAIVVIGSEVDLTCPFG